MRRTGTIASLRNYAIVFVLYGDYAIMTFSLHNYDSLMCDGDHSGAHWIVMDCREGKRGWNSKIKDAP
jgi:hypothetical protein